MTRDECISLMRQIARIDPADEQSGAMMDDTAILEAIAKIADEVTDLTYRLESLRKEYADAFLNGSDGERHESEGNESKEEITVEDFLNL